MVCRGNYIDYSLDLPEGATSMSNLPTRTIQHALTDTRVDNGSGRVSWVHWWIAMIIPERGRKEAISGAGEGNPGPFPKQASVIVRGW